MYKIFQRILQMRAGQGLVEYALILALVGVVLIIVLAVLTSAVSGNLASVVCSLYQMGRDIDCGESVVGTPVPDNLPPVASFTYSCSGRTCTFNGSASSDSDGLIASYEWGFGDGTSATTVGASRTYAADGVYNVILWVTDDDGARRSRISSIAVGSLNTPPTANFVFTCTGFDCSFDGSSSTDADGAIASYSWTFVAGATDTGATPSYTFATGGTYSVTLTVTDSKGAVGTTSKLVNIASLNLAPNADFVFSCNVNICGFNASTSSDGDGSIASYAWDFGDGNSGTGSTSTWNYTTVGNYTVILTITDDDGATDTFTRVVAINTVNESPVASFTATCAGMICEVNASGSSDSDGSITGFDWSFGDGTTGTGVTTSKTYGTVNSFVITLTVTDNNGATNSTTRTVTMTGNTPPVASFTDNCTNLTCTFTSTSTDSDGTISSYAWSFGDTTSGSGATANKTYTSAGTYTVTLTVTDNNGATHSTTRTVTMTANTPPVASFTDNCTNLACTFTSTSTDSDGTISSYAWIFGDTTSGSGATASKTYTSAGTYNVTLTVTDNNGATNSTTRQVTVSLPIVYVCGLTGSSTRTGNTWTATWTVSTCTNNGVPLSGVTVTGSLDAGGCTLAATNASGQTTCTRSGISRNTDSTTLTITNLQVAGYSYSSANNTASSFTVLATPNVPPVASFTVSCTKLVCTVNASGSSDSDGTISSYAWNFGDNTSGSGVTANKTYTSAGTYTITLTVTDDNGATNSTTRQVTVAANVPPVASFTVSCTKLVCTVNASGSTDSDGTISSYAWNFGDNTSGSGVTANKTYTSAGTYTITLTVTDNNGATNSTTRQVTVAANVPPVASFTVSCTNLACTVNASGSTDSDGTISSYAWNFGDNTSGSGVTANKTYTSAGTYIITLTVTDNNGATNSTTRQVTVSLPVLYVCGMTGSATGNNNWDATWTVTVCTNGDVRASGVTVRGTLDIASPGVSCMTTNASGVATCTASRINKDIPSVTFTINSDATGLVKANHNYTPASNTRNSLPINRP
jgi:PKD repeat protein/Flp pilus assembly pilin Flp